MDTIQDILTELHKTTTYEIIAEHLRAQGVACTAASVRNWHSGLGPAANAKALVLNAVKELCDANA